MSTPVFDQIITMLKSWNVDYQILEHADVWTCDVMANFCGCTEREILKSAVLEDATGKIWIYVLPGDKKIRSNPLRRWLGIKNLSFAAKEKAEAACGCDIGCIPPFGHLNPLSIIIDEDVFALPYGYLSPGRHDCSIKIATQALKNLANARYYKEEVT